MKLVLTLMVLMSVSCSYAMDNYTEQAVQNLNLANQLIDQAETNLSKQKKEPLALVLYRPDFLPNTQVINLINQAKSLIDPIINNGYVTYRQRQNALFSLRKIELLNEEIDKNRK